MKAYRTDPVTTERATIETDGGDYVYLESHNDESLDAVLAALNAYDALVAQRDALAGASDGLYDTIQELRHVINGALAGSGIDDTLDAVMTRGRANIKKYHAALALTKETQ